jgi:hypothetical protein
MTLVFKHITENRKGIILGDDLNVRDLIHEGPATKSQIQNLKLQIHKIDKHSCLQNISFLKIRV